MIEVPLILDTITASNASEMSSRKAVAVDKGGRSVVAGKLVVLGATVVVDAVKSTDELLVPI